MNEDILEKFYSMTKEEYYNLPYWDVDDSINIHSIVILPLEEMHDSGFRTMEFVPILANGQPLGRVKSCSDVLHLNGILGEGNILEQGNFPYPPNFKIDILPCGLIRIFGPREMYFEKDYCSDKELYIRKKI